MATKKNARAASSNGTAAATNGNGGFPSVSFAKLPPGMGMPNMLDVQVRAFNLLLQQNAPEGEQVDVGLERVFNEVFPISDVNEKFSLEFVAYNLGEPKYSVEECIERDMTYAAPLKSTLRLVVWEDVEDEDERRPKDIIEKEVYLGDLPLLTDLGTFIINGSERVIVSQLHRSPGVVFEETIHPERLQAVQLADHPVPRLVGRVHHRHPQRHLRPYRQEEEVPGHGAAAGVRLRQRRGRAAPLLHHP